MLKYNNLSEKIITLVTSEGIPYRRDPIKQSFSIVEMKDKNWSLTNMQYCRDTLHTFWINNPTRRIVFYCPQNKIDNVCNFIGFIEKYFKLKGKSVFYKSNLERIYGVFLTPWWTRYALRKSFLSGVIRIVSLDTTEDICPSNLEEFKNILLFKNNHATFNYFSNNVKALDYFLEGYTKSVCKKQGWRETFSGRYHIDGTLSYYNYSRYDESYIKKVLHKRISVKKT